ncbi:hypothetical protein EJP82_25970 [Paenibacillus anaericanus]|uniref:Uncharacterized protein n=1 Tax=Paenibacillus anaericanus TaxID=170367 RepID=A0A3S1E7D7_9BACL|nr:hypothetical protein [Paenibacillus anaericanus]RUT39530.1 hypothetical protein EJP82_25970 [Paenibacillus anaericanus]
MKPLSIILLFLIIALGLGMSQDARHQINERHEQTQKEYANAFQAAVDDTGAYLARFEAQQVTSGIRYQREKQLEFDMDILNVFYDNLALKFGIESNPVAIQNLKVHIPALVLFQYNGYVLITLEDQLNSSGQMELKPVFWPIRAYNYTLKNGSILYFTLDDQVTIYDKDYNRFLQGSFSEIQANNGTAFTAPLNDLQMFREMRQNTITTLVEQDLGGAINGHLEVAKRLGLNIQFTIPRGLNEQSIQNVGFMAFIQGYPLPGGERLNTFSFGGSAVIQRKPLVGVVMGSGEHRAYPQKCVPTTGATHIENLYDAEEAVLKGYFVQECAP